MNLYSPRTIRQLKEKYGFRFAKGLGQNFLTDPSVPEAMVEGSGIGPQDLVIEIGPGIGVLTAAAAQAAGRVVAIEVDERLLPILDETLQEYDNIEVICADVLKTDLAQLIDGQLREHGLTGEVRIIGNLPYYITTPIIMKLLEEELPVSSITVMMQKEVADRIAAEPGTRASGAITYPVHYYARVSEIAFVPKECFYPVPKVDSAVLRLDLRDEPAVKVKDEDLMMRCVKAGFSMRRKTLLNSLTALGYQDKQILSKALISAGIDPTRRAETLTLEEFAKLSDNLQEE